MRHLPPNGKYLLLQTAGIGDLVLGLPAIRAFRKNLPHAQIDLLLHERSRGLFMPDDLSVNQVHYIDILAGKKIFQFSLKAWRDFVSTFRVLRKERYDVMVDFYPIASIGGMIRRILFIQALGKPFTVGRDTDGRGFFYDIPVHGTLLDVRHESDLMLEVVQHLFPGKYPAVPTLSKMTLSETPSSLTDAIKGRKRIVLVPGAFAPGKRWPIHSFAEVAKVLGRERSTEIILVGGLQDREIFQVFERDVKVSCQFVLGGKLRRVAALLKQSDLVIGNDTGMMHLAGALGCKIIALFGNDISFPSRYGPRGLEGNICLLTAEHIDDITEQEVLSCSNKMLL